MRLPIVSAEARDLLNLPYLLDHLNPANRPLFGQEARSWSPFDGYINLPGSGLYVPGEVARAAQRPLCIDLFSGCGGFSLGMIEGGFEVVGAADNDAEATITYLANLGAYPVSMHFIDEADKVRFNDAVEKVMGLREKNRRRMGRTPAGKGIGRGGIATAFTSGCHRPPNRPGVSHFWFGDIRRLTGKAMLADLGLRCGELDCVVGGPPCQGFSVANSKRSVLDPRNALVFEFARLICELQPKTMVMENVPGMLNMVTPEGVPVLDAVCRVLADGGFGAYDALRRSLVGQPQRRGVLAPKRTSSGDVAWEAGVGGPGGAGRVAEADGVGAPNATNKHRRTKKPSASRRQRSNQKRTRHEEEQGIVQVGLFDEDAY